MFWLVRDSYIGNNFFDASASEFIMPKLIERAAKSMQARKSSALAALGRDYGQTPPPGPLVVGRALGPSWATNVSSTTTVCHSPIVGALHLLFQQEMRAVSDLALSLSSACRGWIVAEGQAPLSRTEIEVCMMANEDSSISSYAILGLSSAGSVLSADFLVSATGVRPVTDFLRGDEGIRCCDEGIVVGADLQTTAVGVYAAGDCCSVAVPEEDREVCLWFQMKLWSQARSMGLAAAAAMAGDSVTTAFPFLLFTHITQFFGYRVVLLGRFNGQGLDADTEHVVRQFKVRRESNPASDCRQTETEVWLRVTPTQEYIKLVLHRGKVVGALLIGDTDLEETLENLILNGLDVSHFGVGLLDPDVDLGDYFD